jgi:methyl-accepting chemotaxis protein
MAFLARFRILTKILALLSLLSAVAAGIAFLGVQGLATLNDGADNMRLVSARAMLAALANQNVLALNRAEFGAALDPRPEKRREARRVADEHLKAFEDRIKELGKTRDAQARGMLPAVQDTWADYRRSLDATFRDAESVRTNDSAEHLRNQVNASQAKSEKLQDAIRAVANRLDDRVGEYSRKAAEEYADVSRLMITVATLGILVALALGFLVGQYGIAKPMGALVGFLQRLAKGEDIEIAGTERKDEIGATAVAVNNIKKMLAEKARAEADRQLQAERSAADAKRVAEAREAAAQRSEEERTAAYRKAAMDKLADQFEKAVGNIINNVSSASTELEGAAGTLAKTAGNTQQLSTVVAAASEEASANVQSVASATEEMTGSIGEISRQVQESSTIAIRAVGQAKETDQRITELSHAASRIGDVVKLITAVAEQTNLLALNATIEAARAGEAGRGFAVVASEVKALAAQTAKATGEISAQIATMQTATQVSVTAINQIGDTIGRISEIAATIAAAVEEQGAATQEISRNVQEASKGTAQVATNILAVNRGAGETGSASSQVLSSAKSLASESSHLKSEVANFLQRMRASTLNFDEAIKAHKDWSHRLAVYIQKPDQSLKCDIVSRDDQCTLGKWIHNDGDCFSHLPRFRSMTDAHRRFHMSAGDIVRRADHGENLVAETVFGAASPFTKVSGEVVDALEALKRSED